jgi:hypothetical protein
MSYTSKAQRERAEWMTLVEVVNHIRTVERCEQTAALDQLRRALSDGEIPNRWAADLRPLPFFHFGDPPNFSDDQVPTGAGYWLHALIFLDGDGRVIDQPFHHGEVEGEVLPSERQVRPRGLFLLRSRVLELWPLQNPVAHCESENDSADDARGPPKRRSYTDNEIREAAREVYGASGKNPPNIDKAEQLLREKLPGAQRKKIRPILSEDEFTTLRRKPGNQPKRWNLPVC